jgi:hypothetical protein
VLGSQQDVSDVSGGGERLVEASSGRSATVEIDPLRVRTGFVQDSPLGVQDLADWIVASLATDSNRLRDIELQVRNGHGSVDTVAAYLDVALLQIGVFDPARTMGSPGPSGLSEMRIGFDLVLQPSRRRE